MIQISDEEKLIFLVVKDNAIKNYVHSEKLFDIIYQVHLLIGYGDRNRMEHEINMKFKNITRDSIMLYSKYCGSCKKKVQLRKHKSSNLLYLVIMVKNERIKLWQNLETCIQNLK